MSRGINKVILIGNVGQEPQSNNMSSGGMVCNFSVATSESWTDKQTGEKKESTEWHRVVAFRRLAEICAEYLHKGSKVWVEGKLKTRQWEKDGEKRYTTEVVANDVQFLGGAPSTQSRPEKPPPPSNQPMGDHATSMWS